MSVIPATREVEAGGSQSKARLTKVSKTDLNDKLKAKCWEHDSSDGAYEALGSVPRTRKKQNRTYLAPET
jgi:hypothetical protein